jgi:hypothetical protein
MLLFTCEDARSVPDADVMHIYRGERMSLYCQVTAVLTNAREVSGLIHADALTSSTSREAADARSGWAVCALAVAP